MKFRMHSPQGKKSQQNHIPTRCYCDLKPTDIAVGCLVPESVGYCCCSNREGRSWVVRGNHSGCLTRIISCSWCYPGDSCKLSTQTHFLVDVLWAALNGRWNAINCSKQTFKQKNCRFNLATESKNVSY